MMLKGARLVNFKGSLTPHTDPTQPSNEPSHNFLQRHGRCLRQLMVELCPRSAEQRLRSIATINVMTTPEILFTTTSLC